MLRDGTYYTENILRPTSLINNFVSIKANKYSGPFKSTLYITSYVFQTHAMSCTSTSCLVDPTDFVRAPGCYCY